MLKGTVSLAVKSWLSAGAIFSPGWRLTMSRDISGCSIRAGATSMKWIEPWDPIHPHGTEQPLAAEKHLAWTVPSEEAERPGYKDVFQGGAGACMCVSPLFFCFLNMLKSEKPPAISIINFILKKIPSLLFLQKGEGKKNTHTEVAPWYELPTDDIKSFPLRTIFLVGVINRAQKVMKSLPKDVTDLVPRWASPLGRVTV